MDISRFRSDREKSTIRKDLWDWWLSDESPSAAAREEIRRRKVMEANAYQPRGSNARTGAATASMTPSYEDVKSVVINLHVPKLNRESFEKQNLKKLIDSKPKKISLLTASIVLLLIFINSLPVHDQAKQELSPIDTSAAVSTSIPSKVVTPPFTQEATSKSSSTSPSIRQPNQSVLAARTGPSFTPVVPFDKPELAKSTFGKTAYDGERDVYTYIDSFMGTLLTVNEQKVPSNYKSAQDAVKQNATQIGTTQTLKLTSGTAYLGTDSKTHYQTVILSINNVLIFVNSTEAHSTTDWIPYLASLN